MAPDDPNEFDPLKLVTELEPSPLMSDTPPAIASPMSAAGAQLAELADVLRSHGPPQVKPFAEIIAATAIAKAPSSAIPITPLRLAWVLTGLGFRETTLATSTDCDVAGPTCSGDFTARLVHPRHRTGRHLIVERAEDLPIWVDLTGRQRHWGLPRDPHTKLVLPGPYAIPIDRRGFGRDPWQADWDMHPEVTDARGPAGDLLVLQPTYACDQAALRFLADFATLGKERLGLAAFNCGVDGVRRALNAGQPIDANTEGGDYSRWISDHISGWAGAAFVAP